MAKNKTPEEIAAEQEKQRLQSEKKKLKEEEKKQKQEVKKRAKEIAKQEDALAENEEGNGGVTFLATLVMIILWLAVICIVIKLDLGGIGTNLVGPVIKDIPVLNLILPNDNLTETKNPESYGGYSSLKDAVNQIKVLELELEEAQNESKSKDAQLDALKAEVIRLQAFEDMQVEFQRIRTQFYEEVVYAEKGPGAEEFRKFYEEMDATTAQYIYKQVMVQKQESEEIQKWAQAYSEMKPAQAAKIFEEMTDDLDRVAKILNCMNPDQRGDILGAMDAKIAARLTKLMDPRP